MMNVKLTVFNKTVHTLISSGDKSSFLLAFYLVTDREEILAQHVCRGNPSKYYNILHPILISIATKLNGTGLTVIDYLSKLITRVENEHLE